jgi:radical SAM protein with 4Fe4S-binding SPASM domain
MIGAEFTRDDIESAARNGRLLSMEIELSLRCNFRCKYCYVEQTSDTSRELTPEEIRNAILQAKELGARKIIVLGGEPMIYPLIMEMLTFIREQGMAAEMFTNGTGVTPEAARKLRALGVQVVLKMNSFEEPIQDELAGVKGAYKIIQEAYRNLIAAGYPGEERLMAVSTIICRQNLPEITHLWQWLRDRKITPYFEIITPQGNARDHNGLEVDLPTLHKVFQELAGIDRTRYGVEWDPQPPLVGDHCLRHQFSCLVNAFGSVTPCVGVTIPVGNVRERKLADILRDSEVIQDLRHHTDTIRGPCGACEKAAICYGCRGAAYQLTGDYLASDPLCWRNAERQQEIMKMPAAVSGMIPQCPPTRMVDRLLSVGERVAVVETTIQQDNLFVNEDGTLEDSAYLEIIAQSAAALNGFRSTRRQAAGNEPEGYLLGARDVEVLDTARVGDVLNTRVFKAARYGDFGIIEGQVFRDEHLLARGEIKVWHNTGSPAVTKA